jgi:hypothetical protein
MKQKKLKFTFIGLSINVYFATAFIINKVWDPVLWGLVSANIMGLVGIFAHYNNKDKEAVLSNEKDT